MYLLNIFLLFFYVLQFMLALRFSLMLNIYQRKQKIKDYGGFEVLFHVKNLPSISEY